MPAGVQKLAVRFLMSLPGSAAAAQLPLSWALGAGDGEGQALAPTILLFSLLTVCGETCHRLLSLPRAG